MYATCVLALDFQLPLQFVVNKLKYYLKDFPPDIDTKVASDGVVKRRWLPTYNYVQYRSDRESRLRWHYEIIMYTYKQAAASPICNPSVGILKNLGSYTVSFPVQSHHVAGQASLDLQLIPCNLGHHTFFLCTGDQQGATMLGATILN